MAPVHGDPDDESTHISSQEQLCLVDAGIAFNLPFPPVLRAQRNPGVIIALDQSARTDEGTAPFGELRKAQEWAQSRGVPFPDIPSDDEMWDAENPSSCYLFDSKDGQRSTEVPTIVLIPIVRTREWKEEEEPKLKWKPSKDLFHTYSTFNFSYEEEEVEFLSALTAFNLERAIPMIKTAITNRM